MGDFHPAVEEYLETIYELEEAGIVPMRARIVERLGVSAPSVSETVKRLEREGYLTLEPSSKAMVLTESGRKYATDMVRRHRLAERLLVDVLHVPWHQVHEEACRLEHAISDNLERHLVALLDDPATCPHGNPIPGSARALPAGETVALATVPAGAATEVRRIDEQLESDPAGLLLLERSSLMPGHALTVVASSDEVVDVTTAAGAVAVPVSVAAFVYVLA